MSAFAKLFDTPDGQLLVTKEFDDGEENPYRISMRSEDQHGVDPSIAFGWATDLERDEAFDSVDQARADKTAAELTATVRNFMGKDNDD